MLLGTAATNLRSVVEDRWLCLSESAEISARTDTSETIFPRPDAEIRDSDERVNASQKVSVIHDHYVYIRKHLKERSRATTR